MSTTVATSRTGVRRVLDRWPTAAGVLVAVLSVAAGDGASPVLVAAGFVYLGAAALGNRSAAWPLFWVSFVLIGAATVVPGLHPVWPMLAVAVVLVVVGLARGAVRPAYGLPLQAAVMVLVGAAAVLAATVSPQVGGVLVAAGLFGHAAWDVWHHRTGRVVAHSLAEFCGVLDALLAVLVLWATFG